MTDLEQDLLIEKARVRDLQEREQTLNAFLREYHKEIQRRIKQLLEISSVCQGIMRKTDNITLVDAIAAIDRISGIASRDMEDSNGQ